MPRLNIKMPINKITTIKLAKETKERLDNLKQHEKESYDGLLKRLLNILNICKKSPSLAARILQDIDHSKNREKLIENPDQVKRKKEPSILQQFNISPQNLQARPRPAQRPVSRMPGRRGP